MRFDSLARWSPQVLSILRIVAALLILQFGMAKLFGFPYVQMFQGIQLFSLYGLAGTIELVGGALLLIGLFTRPAAFILSGEMAAAYFIAHFPKGFIPLLNGGNEAVIYCFVFLYFVFAGPGPWSLDAVRETPLSHEMT
ncbi:MAG: putative oxidoreductase [Alphaproteobacteria bacterium]|jgi:putative oxidoreductase|nr:putative oxidoreductase [Alphaproteobacteria bacterium]